MTTRSRRETVSFKHPFRLAGIDRELPGGDYEVVSDEELIEGLSFASYRRTATFILVPGAAPRLSSMEMLAIAAADLAEAQRRDAQA